MFNQVIWDSCLIFEIKVGCVIGESTASTTKLAVRYGLRLTHPTFTEFWLVDINEQIVEVYQQPSAAGYQLMQKFTCGESLSIPGFSDVNISVNEIFGNSN